MKQKFTTALSLALVLAVLLTSLVLADDISNTLDPSVDAVSEVMPLNVGGANGTTQLYVTPRNGDGKNGCNLTGSTTLVLSVASNNPSVATVSPNSVTFTSCSDSLTLTVTPIAQGTATISVSQTSNNTGGTFNLAPATFTVNVAPPANTAPTVSVAGVTGGASYNKGSVPAATCQVTDAEDGNSTFAATLSAVTGTYASDGIGSQTASCSYTDGGGLTATASETYFIIDPSAPVIGYTLNPAAADGSNGWYKSNVTLSWSVTENESPNSLQITGCDNQNITADQAEAPYSCSATSAGGSTGPVEVKIKRDATAPAVSCGVADGLWHSSDVSIACAANDVTSGLANAGDASFSLSTSVTAGTETANASTNSYTVNDVAGNSNVAGPVSGNKIDKKGPALACVGSSVFLLNQAGASVSANVTDAGSGPLASSVSVSVSTNIVGSFTASLTGYDNVGNSTSGNCAYSVIYDWSGFFQPIDNNGVFNVAKSGSTIPVKFSLGGDQGLGILFAGSPSSVQVSCPLSAATDTLEEVTTATSGLKYDALANQYIYNWKTLSGYAGTCRQLTVKLVDGSTHTALFKFTK